MPYPVLATTIPRRACQAHSASSQRVTRRDVRWSRPSHLSSLHLIRVSAKLQFQFVHIVKNFGMQSLNHLRISLES